MDSRNPAPPTRAELCTMFLFGFVPGLNHFRIGQKRRALVALLSCTLLFFAGFVLVRDRIFYYVLGSPERTGTQPNTLSTLAACGLPTTFPELLNLPATMLGAIFSYDGSFTGERLWRLPRDLEHIGAFLTATSGMLAAFWSADFFWLQRLRQARLLPPATMPPALAAGWSWLLPGMAHARLGQRGKGLLIAGCTAVIFAVGMIASGGHAVDRPQAPVWWIGQQLFGGGALLCALLFGPLQMHDVSGLELGLDLTTVAGFMNLVIMVDAYTIAERQGLAAAVAEGPA